MAQKTALCNDEDKNNSRACVCMDNIYKKCNAEKKIHWSMKHKVVTKIVATGGETTWLLVYNVALLYFGFQ